MLGWSRCGIPILTGILFALGGKYKDFALYRFTLLEVNPKAVEMKFLKLVAKSWLKLQAADCEVINQSQINSHEVFLLLPSFKFIIFERFMSFILVSLCLVDRWKLLWLFQLQNDKAQVSPDISPWTQLSVPLPFLVKITLRSRTNPAMRTTKQITPMIEYTNAPFAAPDWIVSKNCNENLFKTSF